MYKIAVFNRTSLHKINKFVSRQNVSKVDDITLAGGAHSQKCFRTQILNLTGNDVHSQVCIINLAYTVILKRTRKIELCKNSLK